MHRLRQAKFKFWQRWELSWDKHPTLTALACTVLLLTAWFIGGTLVAWLAPLPPAH